MKASPGGRVRFGLALIVAVVLGGCWSPGDNRAAADRSGERVPRDGGASPADGATDAADDRRDPDSDSASHAAPFAVIRYGIGGNSAAEFPFGQLDVPVVLPNVGTTVHLSAHLSSVSTDGDRDGTPSQYRWYVEDPAGNEVALGAFAATVRCSFTAARAGVHLIFLQVGAADDGRHAPGRAELRLPIEPWRCAEDGVGSPCDQRLRVTGGDFLLGSSDTEDGPPNERPRHAARVDPFLLDRFEVTVGRFRRYLHAYDGTAPARDSGAHPRIPSSGWRSEWDQLLPTSTAQLTRVLDECGSTWSNVPSGGESRPINCVSWYEAFSFCIWDGGRLPTEAEWEYAAAGGENRLYPWGATAPLPNTAPLLAVFGCFFDGKAGCAPVDLPPVGNAPAGTGRWGHQDLAGSVWEWTLDRYDSYVAPQRVGVTSDAITDAITCDNCANVDGGEGRIFRGGDFHHDDPLLLRSTTRLGFVADHRDFTRGFRCARAVVDRTGP